MLEVGSVMIVKHIVLLILVAMLLVILADGYETVTAWERATQATGRDLYARWLFMVIAVLIILGKLEESFDDKK